MRKMINKSMRRLFAILLSALIMLSAVIPAVAAEDESSAPAGNSQTITEESKDESKTEDLVVEEPEDEEVKDEEPKDEEAKDEEPEDEEPKDEEPKAEEPEAEEPKDEEPKDEEVKDEEPKDEEPEDEEPKDEEPKDEESEDKEPEAEEPKDEEPKNEEPKDEEPKDEEPEDEEPEDEEPKAEEPVAEEPKVKDPADDGLKEEKPAEDAPKAEEPVTVESTAEETKAEEKEAPVGEEQKRAGSVDEPETDDFLTLIPEEQFAAIKKMTDEEIQAKLSEFSEEQINALIAYIDNAEIYPVPETIVFTQAGPFMPPVQIESTARRRLMAKMPSRAVTENPKGLELDKNYVEEDGKNKIILESYTTGEVESHEINVPVDIVLVLDQSGSMAEDFYGNSTTNFANTRQKALIDAVNEFISSVKEKYDAETSDHRISIVTFNQRATDYKGWTYVDDAGASSLTTAVNNLPHEPEGATNVGAAMGRAQHLVTDELNYNGSNTTRQKVVVVFTDGVPTSTDPIDLGEGGSGSEFTVGVANGAINAAQNIKDAGGTVYTIGIFNGARPDELYGATGFDTNSNGSLNSQWSARWGILSGNHGDISTVDVPAGNRFLNFLSSNFNGLKNVGLRRDADDITIWLPIVGTVTLYRTVTYTITANYPRTSDNYYLTASNASGLNTVFQSIAENISTPTISLGSDTVIKDIIAPQLQIPEGATTVEFYTQAHDGNGGWGPMVPADSSVQLVSNGQDDNIVSVTGFDFNANCVTEEKKEDGTFGKKLIIKITVEPDPLFLGGSIDTNGPDSGIYVPGNDAPIGRFPVPNEPFALKPITTDDAVRNIYLSTEDQLADTFSDLVFFVNDSEVTFDNLFNGVHNSSVDYELRIMEDDAIRAVYRIPAGKTPLDEGSGWYNGIVPVLSAHNYTIDSIVSDKDYPPSDPRLDETSDYYDENAPQPVHMVAHIDLNVFKPILTYADKNVYYKGTQIDVASVTPTIEWKCGDTLDTAAEGGMDTTKPTLTYTYDGVSDTTVDQTADYTVKVTAVKNGEVDLLTTYPEGSITFKRDCSVESLKGAAATAAEAFKIHVYTPSFTFNDDVKYYGEAYTLPTVDTSSIAWKNGTTAAPASMDNTAPAVAVTLTPDPATAFKDGYVQVTTDVPVKAVITLGGTDVTAALITAGKITRTCTPEECETVPAATADTAFVVHVKTVSLTIKKSIEGAYADKTKTYSFNVSYSGNVNYSFAESTFTLGHNGEKKLTGLPVGSVTVEESGVPEGYTVAFDFNSVKGNPKTPSEGKASESLNLTAGTKENTVIVHNTLTTVPETGISLNDGMSSALLLMIALGGMAAMAVLSVVKRFSGRVKPVRK